MTRTTNAHTSEKNTNLAHINPSQFWQRNVRDENSTPNIVAIDDNPTNLQVLVEILTSVGYQVRPIMESNLALRSVRQNPPDLILLDILMPELDGYEICQRLKADEQTQHIPILFISALNETIDKVKAFQCGGVDFITKPFQTQEVLVRIEHQLRGQEQERKLQELAQKERDKATKLEIALSQLQQTQAQLIHTKKMLSLGNIVAGLAHEINNPINFISGNINHACGYFQDLLFLVQRYKEVYPEPHPKIVEIEEEIELDFMVEDWQNLMTSIQGGADRISQLILSLRRFSRLDESQVKSSDLNEEIDNILTLVQHQLKSANDRPDIQVIKHYNPLPKIECYASQINQVLMSLIGNAIEAIDAKYRNQKETILEIPTLNIRTEILPHRANSLSTSHYVTISISDNGCGMTPEIQERIFDPFFTTKPVGSGIGLGLAISHQIVVETHKGNLRCVSTPGKGTQMIVEIPIAQF